MNKCSFLATFLAGILPFPSARADSDLKTAGRDVLENHGASVLFVALTVEIAINVGVEGGGHQATESSFEVMGTVVDNDGLVVVANSAIDVASQVLQQIRPRVPADIEVSVDSEVKGAKIILPDGAEVAADVVLQDADLDLAFLRARAPESGEPGPAFVAAPWGGDAPGLQPLDAFLVLGRLGRNLNRTPSIRVGRIESVVRRPRLLYRASIPGLGQPVFNAEGVLVGLFLRQTSGDGSGAPIIRPVRDVLKIAAQAQAQAQAGATGTDTEPAEPAEQ